MAVRRWALRIKRRKNLMNPVASIASNDRFIITAEEVAGTSVYDSNLNTVDTIVPEGCYTTAHSCGPYLASASCDGDVVVYDSSTGTFTKFQSEHTYPDLILVSREDVIVCTDRCTRYTHDGRRLNSIPTGWVMGEGAYFEDILYLPSPQQQKLIVTDKDMVLAKIPMHEDVYAADRRSTYLVVGTAEHLILFSIERPLRPVEYRRIYTGTAVGSVSIRKDAKLLAYALVDRKAVVVAGMDGTEVARYRFDENPSSVSWIGNDLAVSLEDGTIYILELVR